ncbi:MAG: energy transducer TonB, partial [Lutibacter sp.]|nr:energy transducer TonB [Lutibacter sp.]
SLPIAFKVGNDTIKEATKKSEVTYKDDEDVPFAIIDEVPVFPGCEGTNAKLRLCLQEKITKHVRTYFNSDLARNLGLSPGVKRIFVVFKIDKEGNITNVKFRAPHKVLQEEAIRVVNLLPKMSPGKQKGENIGVTYSLPIAFKVE